MMAGTDPLGLAERTSIEQRRLFGLSRQRLVGIAGLGLIILLGIFLRFYNLGAYSIGNSYYAATVQSMLTSWHNFFFASFEPGGSVSVDKPPLGLWFQAISAYFLGVNGFALALPQALAGVLSIPLLCAMVKRQFGQWAGLIAALVLAVTPVTVATERNNTMDGTLMFVLLLAAWAFCKAVQGGRFRYLLLGAFLIGLGFNIKMLQAFMVLPALYALYFIGAPHRWWKRLAHLTAATALLLVVSFAWVAAVDLTPAENRPYVGSSANNTMLELIIGHNGLSRLGLNRAALVGAVTPTKNSLPSPPAMSGQTGAARPLPLPPSGGQPDQLQPGLRPRAGIPPQPPAGPGGQGGNPPLPSQEVGQAGLLRLFTEPLAEEASWLLPLALLGIPLVAVMLGWKWPLSEKHLSLVLWAGWLLPMLAYFSFTTGLWHAYYLIMLGPAIAALVAAAIWALWQVVQRHRWMGWALVASLTGLTAAFQTVTLRQYPSYATLVTLAVGGVWLVGLGLLAGSWRRTWLANAAIVLVCASLLIAPLTLAGLTALNVHPNVALPNAGADIGQNSPNMPSPLSAFEKVTLDYLLANTTPGSYLVATLSSHEAAPYILATQRPVLTFGGFNGGDNVISVDQLAQMVASGELRFVLGGQQLTQRKPQIGDWVSNNCAAIALPGAKQVSAQRAVGSGGQAAILYDCSHR